MSILTEMESIPIHVASVAEGVSLGAAPARQHRRFKTTYETYVLTANDPTMNILPQDPKRYRYSIIAIDNDVILGPTKGVVGAGVNTVASVPNPNGAYFPKGLWRDFYDNGMVYVGVTTIATSSRVTVIAEYYEA